MRALLAALLLVLGPVAPAAASSPPAAGDVSVTVAPSSVLTSVGGHVRLTSTIRNTSDRPMTGLVAHLDVVGLDPAVYVDPEDWSSQRTAYLDPLPANGSVVLPWRVQAVDDGRLVVYVVVTTAEGPAPLAVSDGLRLSSSAQPGVDAAGALPVVLGMPALVLLALLLVAGRRRGRSG